MPDDARSSPTGETRSAYRRAYEATLHAAKDVLQERFRLVNLAQKAYRKTLDEEEAMHAVKDDLFTLIRLMQAWGRGEYRTLSRKTILAVVGAGLYFVSPIDAIPDFIPVVGLADDVAVIAAVVRAVRGDLDRFRAWEAGSERSEGGGAGPAAALLPAGDAAAERAGR